MTEYLKSAWKAFLGTNAGQLADQAEFLQQVATKRRLFRRQRLIEAMLEYWRNRGDMALDEAAREGGAR